MCHSSEAGGDESPMNLMMGARFRQHETPYKCCHCERKLADSHGTSICLKEVQPGAENVFISFKVRDPKRIHHRFIAVDYGERNLADKAGVRAVNMR
jgi:hypothetical protein